MHVLSGWHKFLTSTPRGLSVSLVFMQKTHEVLQEPNIFTSFADASTETDDAPAYQPVPSMELLKSELEGRIKVNAAQSRFEVQEYSRTRVN